MDPVDQLNEQLRQRANAEQQKEKTADRRLTPQERKEKQNEAIIKRIAKEEAGRAIDSMTIQSGQGISVSGSGKNITISAQSPAAATTPQNLVLVENVIYLDTSDDTLHITNVYTDGTDVVIPEP